MDIKSFLELEAASSSEDSLDLRSLDLVSSYDSHLMCPICHCPFVQPVRLDCDHVFCQQCLGSAIITFRSADANEFPCPSCRTPTTRISMSVPRLLVNMCDEIQVRCPSAEAGCEEVLPRGHVQSHVQKYCGFRLVPCPDESCGKMLRQKDLQTDGRCLHGYCRCERCSEDVMERDFEDHDKVLCPSLEATCNDCGSTMRRQELTKHAETCSEVSIPCAASQYGCKSKVRRVDIGTHEAQCPLISIGPYLEAQNTRLKQLELTTRHLQQRNEIFEDGMASIRASLAESARAGNGARSTQGGDRDRARTEVDESTEMANAFSSHTTQYLLSLHESLREEVNQMSHALTDLDTRASMTIMNECLRIKEDMAHTNAALNSVRMQVQWLMNPRLHNGNRANVMRANSTSNDSSRTSLTSTSVPGPSSNGASSILGSLRPRRPSDSGREGTKL
ncbi:hypothetical protein N7539_003653 [Penicillium diatomitis]|uniref:TRAF-like signal transducer n=1 Tax=Penicillium diatomitis TaxID=2819901 RepID=A0A9W9XCZ7_9EURO|nr:uncharacterized protein N7539_003653 [Penicillium diatomitis]KAJ5488763.1 hypothetical protein N7539_003653 [Penicillium diatomitis]